MLVAAAVCPHPPALVSELSRGGAALLAELRAACLRAVAGLAAARPDLLLVIGGGPATAAFGPGESGSMRDYGVDVRIGAAGRPELPLSLTVGGYLAGLADVAVDGYRSVATDEPPDTCAALGVTLAGSADRVALLVMGDGSAKRLPESPGYYDARAEAFDADVWEALRTADVASLLAISPDLCARLRVAGRPAWQTLAGALGAGAGPGPGDGRWRGQVGYDGVPLGVGYAVVTLARSVG